MGRPFIIIIPKATTIWLRNSSDPIGCHGRTASYLTAPAQIPACGTTALGSSEILASLKDKLVLPSLLFPAGRFASVTLSFHRVDLPFDKEFIGSPKFPISLQQTCHVPRPRQTLFRISPYAILLYRLPLRKRRRHLH